MLIRTWPPIRASSAPGVCAQTDPDEHDIKPVDSRYERKTSRGQVIANGASVTAASDPFGMRFLLAAYRLNMTRVLELSEPAWLLIGRNFEQRMKERCADLLVKVVSLQDYVSAKSTPADADDPTPWNRVRHLLAEADPAVFAAWFDKLEFDAFAGGC